MFIYFEKYTRGGVSYLSNRYGKSNNTDLLSHDLTQKWIGPKGFVLNKYTSNI